MTSSLQQPQFQLSYIDPCQWLVQKVRGDVYVHVCVYVEGGTRLHLAWETATCGRHEGQGDCDS